MKCWIFKTEPSTCSIDDLLQSAHGVVWDGVRNYQARNYLRTVDLDDLVLIHHSSCAEVGLVGCAKIVQTAFPDPSQFDPRSPYYDVKATADKAPWSAVKVIGICKFPRILSLQDLRQVSQLHDMQLLKKGNRLSVMPITDDQYRLVYQLGNS